MIYEDLKNLLRKEGWKEQRGGESYINGVSGTNFGKDGELISLQYNESLDNEEWEDLFKEE